MKYAALTLLFVVVNALLPIPAVAQPTQAGLFDVFLSSSISRGQAGLFFVDVRTGLSRTVVTNGSRHTRLGGGVLFLENGTGVIKIAYPDGRIEAFPALQGGEGKPKVSWAVSSDGQQVVWSLSQRQGDSVISDLYVAHADGSERKPVLHTSSTKGLEAVPLAITDDGATVFYALQSIDPAKGYILFPGYSEVFSLSVSTGQSTELPGQSDCKCGIGFSADGQQFVRLAPAPNDTGFTVRLWDLIIKADSTIKAPNIQHRQAGYLLFSRNRALLAYTSARGVPPARNVPAERYAVMVADLTGRDQRAVATQIRVNVRPLAFEAGNTILILVGTDTDGTFKLNLKDGTMTQVSAYSFLGTVAGG